MLMPSHARKVQQYRDPEIPLFHRYQIETQLDAMHNPMVTLKSGGYIVINPTEALVSIDVNESSVRVGREIAGFAGVGDRCDFVHGPSTATLAARDEAFDLVFLDHWKGLYLQDARLVLERGLLRPGGVIVAARNAPD
jgi:hypothetical protein